MSKSLIFSFMPLFYTFYSRIKTRSERFSWFVIYPFFLIWVCVLFKFDLYLVTISFFAVMSVYEIGYLFNDVVTVKKEVNPTIRLNAQNNLFLSYFRAQIIVRFFIALLLASYCLFLTNNSSLFISLLIILFVYFVHNYYRNRINILSYFILVSCRYLVPFILIIDYKFYLFIVYIIISFPLCRTLEHSCKKKYNIYFARFFSGNFDLFRVIYYFFMLLLSIVLYFAAIIDSQYVFLILYFFCVRTLFFIVRNRVVRNKHDSY